MAVYEVLSAILILISGCCTVVLFFTVYVTISSLLPVICIPKRNRMKGLKMQHRDYSPLSLTALACSLVPGSQAL